MKMRFFQAGWIWPLLVSFILKGFLSFQDGVVNSDGVTYLEAARMIAEGHFSQSLLIYPMPAYPLLIGAVHMIIPNWLLAAKLISLFASAAVTIPIYALTCLWFDRRAAFYAAMAAAVIPSLNDIAPDVIRDPCFLLLACGSVYWMAKACMAEHLRGVLGALVIAGAALLFRIEAISLFLVYFIYLTGLWFFSKDQRRFAGKTLILLMAPGLISMVVLLGVGSTPEGMDRMDQLQAFGRHIISGGFFERYQTIYAHLKESERLSPKPSGELYKLARYYMPLIYVIGMAEAFIKSLFWPYCAALWIARRRLSTKGMPLLIAAIVSHSLFVFLYFLHIDYLSNRYMLLSALLALPLVGQGALIIEKRCRQVGWSKTCLTALVMVFLMLPIYRSIGSGFGEDRVIALAGRWLSGKNEFQKVEWAVSDLRYYIYADKPFDFLTEKNDAAQIGKWYALRNYRALEDQARETGKGVIILRESKKELDGQPAFKTYRKVKQIESDQSIVSIFVDPRMVNSHS